MKVLIILLFLSLPCLANEDKDKNTVFTGYTETDDCKEPSTWTPVYDKEDGHLTGYIVSSPCEFKANKEKS